MKFSEKCQQACHRCNGALSFQIEDNGGIREIHPSQNRNDMKQWPPIQHMAFSIAWGFDAFAFSWQKMEEEVGNLGNALILSFRETSLILCASPDSAGRPSNHSSCLQACS